MGPMAIAGFIAAQTVGVEVSRASRLHGSFPVNRPDTVLSVKDSVLPALPDTTLRHQKDTLPEEEDFDFFGDLEDTLPRILARDTMKVPDSLRYTNPFLYEWYVATKDSYTHKIVIDSLKAEGDSILWPRIDSLFKLDSTAVAKAEWDRKWASMTKAERKRWTYENVKQIGRASCRERV